MRQCVPCLQKQSDLLKASHTKLALLSTLTNFRRIPPPESIVKYSSRSQRNVYLLKIEANSLRDGSQDIYKDKESNLGPFAGF